MKSVFTSFAAVFITLSACGGSEQPITCEAGHFIAGQNASVTCNFHFSVRDSGHNIYVVHYPFNASTGFSGNDVLHCFRSRQKKLECRVKESYHFNNNITTTLTVTIPKVNKDFAGKYVCQLVPPNSRSATVCNLIIEDPALLKQHESRTNVYLQTGQTCVRCDIVILVLSSVIAFLVGVIVAYAVYPTIIRKRTSSSETPTDEVGKITTQGEGKASHLNNLDNSVHEEDCEEQTATVEVGEISTRGAGKASHPKFNNLNISVPVVNCEVRTLAKIKKAISETKSNFKENNYIQARHYSSLPVLVYQQTCEEGSTQAQTETLLSRGEYNEPPETNPSFVTQVVSTVVGVDREEMACRIL